MKNTKVNLVIFFISLFVFVGMTGIFLVANSKINLQETDVTYLTAKVESVETNRINSDGSYRIHTKEYRPYLLVEQNLCSSYDLSTLKSGDKITFSVENDFVNLLESDKESNARFFVTVVSLKTENEEIFTLENFNKASKDSFNEPFVIIIVLVSISLFFLIKSSLAIIKNKKKTV